MFVISKAIEIFIFIHFVFFSYVQLVLTGTDWSLVSSWFKFKSSETFFLSITETFNLQMHNF